MVISSLLHVIFKDDHTMVAFLYLITDHELYCLAYLTIFGNKPYNSFHAEYLSSWSHTNILEFHAPFIHGLLVIPFNARKIIFMVYNSVT